MQELATSLFVNVPKKSFDGLVVHVRAGNIYKNPLCGPYLVQAPLKYFSKAIETLKIKRDVLVITQAQHGRPGQPGAGKFPSPMTAEIVKYCKGNNLSCRVHEGPIAEAVGYLLGAKHAMLTGYTTFSRALLLANPNLRSVIIPSIPLIGKELRYNLDGWPQDEICFRSHKCDTHYFDIKRYIKQWTREGLQRQINHSARHIEYRG